MSPLSKSRLSFSRVFFIILFLATLYAVLVVNFYRLQINKGNYYAARAESQYKLAGFLRSSRGNIYFTDKNGNAIPAAINKNYPAIFAVPKEVEDPKEMAATLQELIGTPADKTEKLLTKENDLYELLVRKAASDAAQKVSEAALKGVYVDDEERRYYPFAALASHLLGYVGESEDGNDTGKYGVESFRDKILSGKDGEVRGPKIIKSVPGEDVNLTIDRNIQARAEEILQNLIETKGAMGGTVIVQEPSSGKILAMGSYPTFDPNNYASSDIKSFLNPAVQALYEPGSVFKVITMAAALDAGKITPETTYFDTGELTLDGKTIKNWDKKGHGKVTMTEVIEGSINTGAAFAERKLGHDNFYNYLVKMGFSDKTGIDLPGEVAGNLRNLKSSFREINFATASFGQGVAVTPLELISGVSAIANGGLLMRPYISADLEPIVVRRVIGKDAALKTTRMMASAVKKAEVAQIPKYDVAGKTGTAFVPDFKKGGYTEDVINTYAGYAPAFDPKFVILIKIDKPAGAPLAGTTVVPAFKELAQFVLNYYNIGPDHD